MTLQLRDIDNIRKTASKQLDQDKRSDMGQYMTPSPVADFMAGMFKNWPEEVRLLDPGAGIGSLSEAFSNKFIKETPTGSKLHITTFELDKILLEYLEENLSKIKDKNRQHSVTYKIFDKDFIAETARALEVHSGFTHSILNPPYKKIASGSVHRRLLHELDIETPNLYAAFLALSILLSEKGGEIVAIIPRSFCNGLYFRPFRKWLLGHVTLRRIHLFESRTKAFQDDNVLQENVIVYFQRGVPQEDVMVSMSNDATFTDVHSQVYQFSKIVDPADREKFIRIPAFGAEAVYPFHYNLNDLKLMVSTGQVVDFRVRDYWSDGYDGLSVPLLYPHHFSGGKLEWPRKHKKPNAIRVTPDTSKLLMPRGWYVVIRRLTSKEERRRIVAYLVDPERLSYQQYGFENHLNVLHSSRKGLEPDLAKGLALFLNSTIIDMHFRTFSGHTQVNATDLRSIHFPAKTSLRKLGRSLKGDIFPEQVEIDKLVAMHVNLK